MARQGALQAGTSQVSNKPEWFSTSGRKADLGPNLKNYSTLFDHLKHSVWWTNRPECGECL